MKTYVIRFHGSLDSLTRWRELVGDVLGRMGGCILPHRNSFYYDITLNTAERNLLDAKFWGQASGRGTLANGMPLRWNDCISYSVI